MKKLIVAVFLFIIGLNLSISGTALTIYGGNDYYRYEDPIDSTKNGTDLLFDFGFGLENIGGSGLSLISDWMASNVFHDGLSNSELRSPYQMNTGYFDWRSPAGRYRFRLGRQQYTNLSIETFDVDGLRAEFHPTAKSVINATAGMYVPTPYNIVARHAQKTRTYVVDTVINGVIQPVQKDTLIDTIVRKFDFISDPAKRGILSLDGSVSAIPFTTITAAAAIVPKAFDKTTYRYTYDPVTDSTTVTAVNETNDFRMALGTIISPVSMLRLVGSGRFSLIQKGIDRFDGRLTLLPIEAIELSAYIIGEKGRIDSTNYFSILFNKQITEFGLSMSAFPGEDFYLFGDYHINKIASEGIDHFLSFDVSNRYLNGGIVLGAGFHGLTFRPYGGIKLPFLKVFTLEGSGEYCYIDETDKDNIYHLLQFSGGLKIGISPIGLTIFPRVEYITNRYFTKDLRLLVTTNLLINRFWGGKP